LSAADIAPREQIAAEKAYAAAHQRAGSAFGDWFDGDDGVLPSHPGNHTAVVLHK
jgi:hypothetical protein